MSDVAESGSLRPSQARLVDVDTPPYDGLSYSLRRYFVDEFFGREVARLATGTRVLDLGGKKIRKRGRFDVEQFDLRVTYVNTDEATEPDVIADAASVPKADGSFDAVLCAELLEHVLEPTAVLRECYRLLRPGGTLLISVPFLHPIHGDPHDYGRYTPEFFREQLARAGLEVASIENQGALWSVLVDGLRSYLRLRIPEVRWLRFRHAHRLAARLTRRLFHRAVAQDAVYIAEGHAFSAYTTGFGVVATRANEPDAS